MFRYARKLFVVHGNEYIFAIESVVRRNRADMNQDSELWGI